MTALRQLVLAALLALAPAFRLIAKRVEGAR